jgi:2-C-methyl-D-erythritol 2,4-cyclodiphosphate synthase
MRENISNALMCDITCVNIKATTEEHLGFTGAGEGIASHAVVLLTEE